MHAKLGTDINGGGDVCVDLDALIGSHLLAIANSGFGKSGLLRRLFEQTHGHVQHIILDVEDEFYTLRQQYDYVIAGGDGADVPATLATAAGLARAAMDHGFSLIVQLNDLGDDAPAFVRLFLDALMSVPREQWRPLLVGIDETQRFAPSSGSTDATSAIRALLQRGRKRGFTAVLASLRISEVDPGVRGLVNNWMLGKVGQSLDRDNTAKQLGFRPASDEARELQALPKRVFWSFGPALSEVPVKFFVSKVSTTPVRPGQAKLPTPPPPEALREIMAGLAAPAAAEQAADGALTPISGQIDPNPAILRELTEKQAENADLSRKLEISERKRALLRSRLGNIAALAKLDEPGDDFFDGRLSTDVHPWVLRSDLESGGSWDFSNPWGDPSVPNVDAEPVSSDVSPFPAPAGTGDSARGTVAPAAAPPSSRGSGEAPPAGDAPTGRALEVLDILCGMTEPGRSVTEKAWAMQARVHRKSSTWRGYKAKLRAYFEQEGQRVSPLQRAYSLFPELPRYPRSGKELIEHWAEELPSGAARALRAIAGAHPNPIDRWRLADLLETTPSSSTFRGYLAPLSTLELIERVDSGIRLAPEIMENSVG